MINNHAPVNWLLYNNTPFRQRQDSILPRVVFMGGGLQAFGPGGPDLTLSCSPPVPFFGGSSGVKVYKASTQELGLPPRSRGSNITGVAGAAL